jgi:DNA-binding NarL/FixJ family response regulator
MSTTPSRILGETTVNDLGHEIYLIGPNRLYNELLARCIGDETGVECLLSSSLGNMPSKADNDQKRLVLYDFSSCHDSLESLIASDTKNILQSDYVVLTNVSDTLHIECEALECGVRGFLYYQGGIDTLLKMTHSVLNSELWISRELMTKLLLEGGLHPAPKIRKSKLELTAREFNILSGLSIGLTNQEIAEKFCLSPHTVKTHIYHIFKKIKVGNRVEAAHWAARNL